MPEEAKFPWQVIGTPVRVVDHPWFCVVEYDVLFPNGLRQIRTVLEDRGGAGALAVTDKDEIILLDLDRFASRLVGCLELPGGGLHEGKTPLETAQEELLEETGLIAERWEAIFPVYRAPAANTCVHHLFLATGLREATEDEKAGVKPDSNELINAIVRIPFDEALSEIGRRIVDSVTITALLWLQIQRLRAHQS